MSNQFVNQIKENFLQLTTLTDNCIPTCVAFLLTVQAQMKVLHWQTVKFSEHQAFEKYYTALNTLVDKFVESYTGKYDRISFIGNQEQSFSLCNYDMLNEEYLNIIFNCIDQLRQAVCEDSELLNILDEVKAETYKLKYLLTLE